MKLFGERVVFFEKAKLSFKAVKKETWRGIIGATIFGSICVACGFFAGHAVGFSHYKSPVYFNYMLRSSYGNHTLGSTGKTAEESRNRLNSMISMAKEYNWSLIGEPFVIEGKEGQVYMYQKIMKLYKGKDEE